MERQNKSPNLVAVAPSDATIYVPALIALRVGTTAGAVAVKTGGVTVVIPNVLAGETIYGSFNQILATGTAAVGITGFQWDA